jgi:hypothetical protein
MVTMESWMFLTSYERFRKTITRGYTIRNLAHFPYDGKRPTVMGINFGVAVVTIKKAYVKGYIGDYCCSRHYELNESGVPFEFPTSNERLNSVSEDEFSNIPGNPIAYWVTKRFRKAFAEGTPLGEIATAKPGLCTGHDERFIREWAEVSFDSIGLNCHSRQVSKESKKTWFPFNKGGPFRRWFGNQNLVVNWRGDGEELSEFSKADGKGTRIQNTTFYFRPGITWNQTGSRADHPHGEPRLPLRRQAQRRGAVDPLPPGHHGGTDLLRHRLHDGPLQPRRTRPDLRPRRQRRLRRHPLQDLPGRRRRHRAGHRRTLVRGRRRQPCARVPARHLGRREAGREHGLARRQPGHQGQRDARTKPSAATSPTSSSRTTCRPTRSARSTGCSPAANRAPSRRWSICTATTKARSPACAPNTSCRSPARCSRASRCWKKTDAPPPAPPRATSSPSRSSRCARNTSNCWPTTKSSATTPTCASTLDLDDGVKVNYGKFGDLLAEVKAVTGWGMLCSVTIVARR